MCPGAAPIWQLARRIARHQRRTKRICLQPSLTIYCSRPTIGQALRLLWMDSSVQGTWLASADTATSTTRCFRPTIGPPPVERRPPTSPTRPSRIWIASTTRSLRKTQRATPMGRRGFQPRSTGCCGRRRWTGARGLCTHRARSTPNRRHLLRRAPTTPHPTPWGPRQTRPNWTPLTPNASRASLRKSLTTAASRPDRQSRQPGHLKLSKSVHWPTCRQPRPGSQPWTMAASRRPCTTRM